MITADQLIAHAVGDYVLQSDWMANEKTKQNLAAAVHAFSYGIPFLFLSPSWQAMIVIIGTHFLMDRYRLARYVVWIKNQVAPDLWRRPWSECSGTGYHNERPPWMAVWLLIIADNIIHVLINGLALRYL